MRQALFVLFIAALAMLALAACDAGASVPNPGVTLTDDAGRAVSVVSNPQRIVSLAPSNTEILFALGLGDQVVGVTDFCDYPPEATAKAKVGGITPNVEQIVTLKPDLVVTIGGDPFPAELITRLEELGLPTLVLAPKDLDSVYHDIELVGQATGKQAEAKKLVDDMKARAQAVTDKCKNVASRPTVFYELDATDAAKPFTVGPGSWHDTFIQIAGGTNVAANAPSPWVQFSMEELVKSDPALIILGDANRGVTADAVKAREGWGSLKAVQSGAIYPIDDNLISRPGPRVVDGLEALARIIHPELF
ncbi:MAG: ABC transporter substrate-binding protein [Chloroflexi bacterium]|nr:ABC transporter substrate-binding protein [Chloroflexota bacterium]MBU1751770.1 ABC transporter substrate-binding protein [Chloroflexota bacterium]MBU1878461.1 ABC transporter substrate-binding protein [Chloroflexota bacterium]